MGRENGLDFSVMTHFSKTFAQNKLARLQAIWYNAYEIRLTWIICPEIN